MKQYLVGIDYSMNSPSVAIYKLDDNTWNFKNIKFYYFNSRKKSLVKTHNLEGDTIPEYPEGDDIGRWDSNSQWVISVLNDLKENIVGIAMEGYSYGSKGSLLFNIAENTCLLKYKLRKLLPKIPLEIFTPGQIKKLAGKGNFKKMEMYEAFLKDTKFDLTKVIDSSPEGNPISDIVDSYWICKLLYSKIYGSIK